MHQYAVADINKQFCILRLVENIIQTSCAMKLQKIVKIDNARARLTRKRL